MAQLALLLDLLFGLLSGLSELVARGIAAGLLAGSLSCNIDMLGGIALLAAASGPEAYLRQTSGFSLMRLLNLLKASDTSASVYLVSLPSAINQRVSLLQCWPGL